MKNLIITIIVLCLSVSAMAQEAVYNQPEVDKTRTLVFFPDRDIAPPYVVDGEVLDGVAAIYLNNILVERNNPRGLGTLEPTDFDICRVEMGNIQCEMKASGHSHEEVVEAVANYLRTSNGVIRVEREEIQLMVYYSEDECIEYWVHEINCDMQKTVDWKVDRLQRYLDKGYAHVYTGKRVIKVKPCEYEQLVAELSIARDSTKAIETHQWKFLTPEMVESIRQSRGE